MSRPDRLQALIDTAEIWAKRSTCDRLHVGAVIHREGRILVQGYNGAPAGMPHCDHVCTCPLDDPTDIVIGHLSDCPAVVPCKTAVHAEQSAITWAARNGVPLEGSGMVVTHMPCYNCALSIINAGIAWVAYLREYRDDSGVKLLNSAGVECHQPSRALYEYEK